jgi:hypothetical protein
MRDDGTQSVPARLGHNVWSNAALPVVVTLVGWLALGKSLLILFLSSEASAAFFLESLHYEQLFYRYAAASLLLCLYLTYGARGANWAKLPGGSRACRTRIDH